MAMVSVHVTLIHFIYTVDKPVKQKKIKCVCLCQQTRGLKRKFIDCSHSKKDKSFYAPLPPSLFFF